MPKLIKMCMAVFWPLGACAIKPIPDNVTGRSTAVIVHQVRCESQRAIISLLVDQLRRKSDEDSHRIADAIEREIDAVERLKNYKKLDPAERFVFSHFDDTAIVFDFQLRMTENDDLGGGTTVANAFATGMNVVGIKVVNNKERQNFRTFRVTTNIKEIFKDDCSNATGRYPNYEYPIAGEIGLKETFQQYFEIALVNTLGPMKDWDGVSPFVDTMKFTTTVSGEIDPSRSLTTLSKGYVIKDASAAIGAKRTDEHQLAVGLSLPKDTKAFGGPQNAVFAANTAVDRAIVKSQIFGLPQINPFGVLNAP